MMRFFNKMIQFFSKKIKIELFSNGSLKLSDLTDSSQTFFLVEDKSVDFLFEILEQRKILKEKNNKNLFFKKFKKIFIN